MAGGLNRPPVLDGAAYAYPTKTLLQLRTSLMRRLGFSAMLASPPPGLAGLLDDFLQDAQEQLYAKPRLRAKMWWKVDVTAGNRIYDIPSNTSGTLADVTFTTAGPDTITRVGGSWLTDGFRDNSRITFSGSASNNVQYKVDTVTATVLTLSAGETLVTENNASGVIASTVNWETLDHRHISEAWLQDGTVWNPLFGGINAGEFNLTSQTIPTNYEMREYLEIWPEPDKAYTLWFKGHFGLKPFLVDTDLTTIDYNIVFLHALANAKAHYRHPDAGTYYTQLEVMLRNLNADTFGTKRYIPHGNEVKSKAEPLVTFPR